MIALAMYKQPGLFFDKVVRWKTNSLYSHCELVIGDWCYSSSPRDGGVRKTKIDLSNWDVLNLHVEDQKVQDILKFYSQTEGLPYNYWGILFNQTLRINEFKNRGSYFCSEWCAAALGVPNPSTYSPQKLYDLG